MSHSEDIFVSEFGVHPAKLTPLKSWDLALALKTQRRGGGVLLKRCFSQEVKRSDPSLCGALGDMIFLLAAQAFEGDIEV